MPNDPSSQSSTQQTSQSMKGVFELLGLIAVALVAAFAAFYIYLRFTSAPQVPKVPVPEEMQRSIQAGEYRTALSEYEKIQASPKAGPDEKALASLNKFSLNFRLTADVQSRIKDIQEMKKIILDPTVSSRLRVTTLDTLSTQYCNSGRDPQIFAELYKDEPFSKLKTDDPDLSARLAAEWSYSIRPTSFNSIRIAHWYSKQWMIHKDMPEKQKQEYIAITLEYLKKAEEMSVRELERDKDFEKTLRYIGYRFWRSAVVSRLGRIDVEPYNESYRAEYDNFIKFALTQDNVYAKDYLYFGRMFFAQHLNAIGDKATAKAQLEQLARDLSVIASPNSSSYVRYMRHESKYYPTEFPWSQAKMIRGISAAFDEQVDRLLASDPEKNQSGAFRYTEDVLPIL